MSFTPGANATAERRKVVVTEVGDGTWTVKATRVFATGATQNFTLDLNGTSTDVNGAMVAAQNFMRTGAF